MSIRHPLHFRVKWPQINLRRVLAILLICVVAIALVTAASYWVVTRSWFITWQITPELERKLGGDVSIGSAEYQGNGQVIFTDVKLRARGIHGEAGEVANIARAVVSVDMRRLLRWNLRISEIVVDHAVLRVSEDKTESGQLNL